MKQFAGIAAVAFAAHAGLASAQPVIIERGDLEHRGGERSMQRGAPMRAPAEPERGAPQRIEPQSSEQRDVRSGPSRGQDIERPQQQQREQARRERPAEPSTSGSQPSQREQAPDRGQAQRDKPDSRGGGGTNERAQQHGRPSNTSETAQPQRPDQRTAPTTARRPAPTEPTRSDSATQSQGPSPQNRAGTPPHVDKSEQGGHASSQPRSEADQQRIVESVRDRVDRNEVKPVRDFGVSVTVGAQLPSRVELSPIPSDIATLRPQYREYRYTVSESQIVIVDPGSRRVVEVIDRSPGRAGSANYYSLFEQRDVRRWRRPGSVAFRAGVMLPTGVPLHALPVEVIERNPAWRDYQYVMTETDEIAVVEPRTHRIVDVIDKDVRPTPAAAIANDGGSVSAASGDRHDLARIILQDARPGDIQGIDGLMGAVLPSEVILRPLPAEVEKRDAQLRGYQYTLIGDDVLIIDPQTRRIIDVIE
ncbi:MAG TPA: DUF1236 domain-containing protein [Bosea sp. (in: a-proteobacteria)]